MKTDIILKTDSFFEVNLKQIAFYLGESSILLLDPFKERNYDCFNRIELLIIYAIQQHPSFFFSLSLLLRVRVLGWSPAFTPIP